MFETIKPETTKRNICTRQMMWDALLAHTPFLPHEMDANDKELCEEHAPHIQAMINYVFYEGIDAPELNDIKRSRAADLMMIASVILDATRDNLANNGSDSSFAG